jgi:HK97 gp10 family phage protein
MPVTYDNSELLALRARLHDEAVEVVSSTAMAIEAEAKVHVPRDPARPPKDLTQKVTGALRNSIQAAMEAGNGLKWKVNVGQAYGLYQEFGTKKMPARPYLVPAVEKYKQQFFDKIKAIVVR